MEPNTIHSRVFKSAPQNPKNILWQGWITTKFQIGKGFPSLRTLQVFTTHTLNMPWPSNLQLFAPTVPISHLFYSSEDQLGFLWEEMPR